MLKDLEGRVLLNERYFNLGVTGSPLPSEKTFVNDIESYNHGLRYKGVIENFNKILDKVEMPLNYFFENPLGIDNTKLNDHVAKPEPGSEEKEIELKNYEREIYQVLVQGCKDLTKVREMSYKFQNSVANKKTKSYQTIVKSNQNMDRYVNNLRNRIRRLEVVFEPPSQSECKIYDLHILKPETQYKKVNQ